MRIVPGRWQRVGHARALVCWGRAAKMSPFFVISMGPVRWRSKTDKRARAAAGTACLDNQCCYREPSCLLSYSSKLSLQLRGSC